MNEKKRFGVLLVIAGLVLAFGSILWSFASLDAEPVLLAEPMEAVSRVEDFMDSIVSCDYETASSLIYGKPALGLEREPAEQVGVLLWDAFAQSQRYELKDGCVAKDSGLVQQVVLTYLDMNSVTVNLADRSKALLMARVENAENPSEIYDANNEYREDVVMEVLEEAVIGALKKEGKTVSVELALNLIYQDEQWWIVADNALLNAISGGILY